MCRKTSCTGTKNQSSKSLDCPAVLLVLSVRRRHDKLSRLLVSLRLAHRAIPPSGCRCSSVPRRAHRDQLVEAVLRHYRQTLTPVQRCSSRLALRRHLWQQW